MYAQSFVSIVTNTSLLSSDLWQYKSTVVLVLHLLCLSLRSISSHCVPTRSNVKHFSQNYATALTSAGLPLVAQRSIKGRGQRTFSHAIGRGFAGGVSFNFIHKSSSGASLQHVKIPLFILMNTCPGAANVSGRKTLQPRQKRECDWF